MIKMDDIFITFPLRENSEAPCLDEKDTTSITRNYCKFRIQINKEKKTLFVDSLIRHHSGGFQNDYPDKENGTYVFKGDHFELKK